ncbi:MAG: AAA family ATPase [Chloroflexota bacterium]
MATSAQTDKHARFTDAPFLPKSLLLGSVRLLVWLFFHPSAWHNQLERLDLGLEPNFCLAGINGRQLRSLSFWRLLLQLYLFWPLGLGIALSITLLLFGYAPLEAIPAGMVATATGLLAALAVGLVASVPSGIAVGLAVGSVVGATAVSFLTPNPNQTLLETVIGLASGLAGGLGFGVAAGIHRPQTALSQTHPVSRQISGVIISVFVGLGAGFLASLARTSSLLSALVIGLPFGLALWSRTNYQTRSLIGGLLAGLVAAFVSSSVNEAISSPWTILFGLLLICALFALPYTIAEQLAGPWSGMLAGALGSGAGFYFFITPAVNLTPLLLFTLLGVLSGLTLAWWRPIVSYPFLAAWNRLLFQRDEQQPATPYFRYHSAFWDEQQRLPLAGLDQHLLLVLKQWPQAGEQALAYLATSRQRWAAQAAQIELEAQKLEGCETLTAVSQLNPTTHPDLKDTAAPLLRSFHRLSQDIAAATQQESAFNQRLALRAVEERLDSLLRELTRSSEPHAQRFHPIAQQWQQLVAQATADLAAEAELRQEIDSPYIIGVPLTEKQEIFVGRTDISTRIEQLLLDRRRPPLLLYGQRRVGKTSLLNNLGRLLPSTIVPLFVDLQGPASRAKDAAGFFYNLARAMRQSAQRQRQLRLPELSREQLAPDPFTVFDEWLDSVEMILGRQTALLMLDEFEVLERVFAKSDIGNAKPTLEEEAILGTLRHLIQHRPRFKVLLSGSHTLDAFQRWSSYLINVQTIHIGHLSPAETYQLVEQPVANFALAYEPVAKEHVYELTNGHPFLVQLLCAEIVALKNEQPSAQRRLATLDDVETAVSPALDHGSFFFADIQQNQVTPQARRILHTLARNPSTSLAPTWINDLAQLQARELLTPNHQFQVELIRRWFAR